VDLNEITSIDKDGEQVLLMMIRDGAKLVATGVFIQSIFWNHFRRRSPTGSDSP